VVFPDERVAVIELTNQDSVDASAAITRKTAPLLFMHDDVSKEEQQSRAVFEGLQQGKINRSTVYRRGMTFRQFEAHFPPKTLEILERIMPDGKIEQYQVAAKNSSSSAFLIDW
jgi:hypothetical protein